MRKSFVKGAMLAEAGNDYFVTVCLLCFSVPVIRRG
jgi:hypothetical protein